MVSGVEQVWHRTGYVAPLQTRWAEACAKLLKLSPASSSLCGQPRSELALDAITDEISRLMRPPPDDPAIASASRELSDLKLRYHRAWLDVRGLQTTLRRSAKNSEVHRLLGDIPGDAFADVGEAIDQGGTWAKYHSAREVRSEIAKLLPRVLEMEGRGARLVAVLNTASEPDEVLNRRLVMRLFGRVQELERQVEQLKVRKTVGERAAAAIAAHPEKSDRAIAEELGVGKDTVRRARKLTGALAPHLKQSTNQRKATG
jgi:hypothetical protein